MNGEEMNEDDEKRSEIERKIILENVKNSLSVGIWYQVPWMCGSSGTTTIAFSFLLDDKGV